MADHLVDGPPSKRQKLIESTLSSSDSADYNIVKLWDIENELPEELSDKLESDSSLQLSTNVSGQSMQNGAIDSSGCQIEGAGGNSIVAQRHQQLSQFLQNKANQTQSNIRNFQSHVGIPVVSQTIPNSNIPLHNINMTSLKNIHTNNLSNVSNLTANKGGSSVSSVPHNIIVSNDSITSIANSLVNSNLNSGSNAVGLVGGVSLGKTGSLNSQGKLLTTVTSVSSTGTLPLQQQQQTPQPRLPQVQQYVIGTTRIMNGPCIPLNNVGSARMSRNVGSDITQTATHGNILANVPSHLTSQQNSLGHSLGNASKTTSMMKHGLPQQQAILSGNITGSQTPAQGSSTNTLSTPTVTNSNISSQSGGTHTTDPEKRKLIQQQLVLLLHAHKCQRRENQANGEIHQCSLPHCRTMKHVLNHMTTCQAGKTCPIPHCASSRQIISHWKNCTRNDCPVCLPLKQASDRKQQPSGVAVQPNQGPAPADMQRAYAALGLPYNGNGHSNFGQVLQHNKAMKDLQSLGTLASNPQQQGQTQENQLRAVTPNLNTQDSQGFSTTEGAQSNLAGKNMIPGSVASSGSLPGDVSNQISTVVQSSVPQPASGSKIWHQSVTPNLRHHLVQKIVQAIFPTPDPSALQDKRMINLVAYARTVEGVMYEKANSREEYYHLLAEKIYKIQKELEEKRQKRKEQQQQDPLRQTNQTGSNVMQFRAKSLSSNTVVVSQPHMSIMSQPNSQQRIPPPNITISGSLNEFFPNSGQLANSAVMNPSNFTISNAGPTSTSLGTSQTNRGVVNIVTTVSASSFDVVVTASSSKSRSVCGSAGVELQENSQLTEKVKAREITMQQQVQLPLQTTQMQIAVSSVSGINSPVSVMQISQPQQTGGQVVSKPQIVSSLQMPPHSVSHAKSLPQSSTPQPQSQQIPVQQPPRSASVPESTGNCPQPTFISQKVQDQVKRIPSTHHQNFHASQNSLSQFSKTDSVPSKTNNIPSEVCSVTLSEENLNNSVDVTMEFPPTSSVTPVTSVVSTISTVIPCTATVGAPAWDCDKITNSAVIQMEVEFTEVKKEIKEDDITEIKPDDQIEVKNELTRKKSATDINSCIRAIKEEAPPVKQELVVSQSCTISESTSVPSDVKNEPFEAGSKLPPKPKPNKKIFKPDELRQALMPTLEKLYRQDPESLPFRQPVDPQMLQIPHDLDRTRLPWLPRKDLSTLKVSQRSPAYHHYHSKP